MITAEKESVVATGRYARQLLHPGFEPEHQERLRNSTVLVAGIGGVGGIAAQYLAGAGVGQLVIIHSGNLELPDLNRQTLMKDEWIGLSRAEGAAHTLREFNPETGITSYNLDITSEIMDELLMGVDLAISARHNFPERRTTANSAREAGIPCIEAAMSEMEGYIFTIQPNRGACFNCLCPEDPPWQPLGFPVFGAVAGVIGSMAAVEAIKLLSGYEKSDTPALKFIDFRTMEMRAIELNRRSSCEVCGGI